MTELSVPPPDLVRVQSTPLGPFAPAASSGARVEARPSGLGLRIEVGTTDAVARVVLRWHRDTPRTARVLGDAWERGYGDLEWRTIRPETAHPWSAVVHDPTTGRSEGFGVDVRGGALAFWQIDGRGVTLVLDVRSGGAAVRPGDRAIHAATVRFTASAEGPFRAQRELAATLCADPLTAGGPLVGANNWYYAYGRGFGLAAVIRDARMIVELADGHRVRPFAVIDDGWSVDGTADGRSASPGPWDRGRPAEFPDMRGAADAIRDTGARPGIWFRPLLTRDRAVDGVRGPRDGAFALDPSAPAVRDLVATDVARLAGWGFELIKHDFSTYDLLGQWGPQFTPTPSGGPALADPAATTAEALVAFYRTVREASADALVLGCNVIGHLAAGLVHAQRIGDDTSGRDWNRTRRVGVNTLAFRLAQHDAFFTADADCVPSTPHTDWEHNRQFLDLVARSGTALFVSVDPATRSARVDDDLARALRLALDGGDPGGVEPIDWFDSPTPSRWRSGRGETTYDWLTAAGADAFEPFGPASPPPGAEPSADAQSPHLATSVVSKL